MESNQSNKTVCSSFNEGADLVLIFQTYILIVLALISFSVSSLFLHLLKTSTGQTGVDVRSLLLSSLVACIIRSIYFFFRGVYVLLLIDYGFDKLAINWLLCAFIDLPYGVATAATVLCMLAIGVNRFHVTKPIDRGSSNSLTENEHRGRRNSRISAVSEGVSKGTKLTIGLIWTSAVVFYSILMIGMNAQRDFVCFCYYPVILKPWFSYVSNVWFLLVEISILITYAFVFVRNRNMLMQFTLRTRQYNLRQRCRAWMNVRTTRMLLPPAIVHVFLVLVVICCMSPIRDALAASADTRRLKLVLLMQTCVCLDIVAYPLLCIRFNVHFRLAAENTLKKLLYNFCPVCRTEKSIGPLTEIENNNSRKNTRGDAQKVVIEDGRPRSSSIHAGAQLTSGVGKRTIIDYRLAPEAHEHIMQRTWEMKPRSRK